LHAGDENHTAAQEALAAAQATTVGLRAEKRAGDEAYAYFSQEDAEGRVGLLELELKNRSEEIAANTADATF
jgi:hypothetical protein